MDIGALLESRIVRREPSEVAGRRMGRLPAIVEKAEVRTETATRRLRFARDTLPGLAIGTSKPVVD